MGREGGVLGLNEEKKGMAWEAEIGACGPSEREPSGRGDGGREGGRVEGSKERKLRNSVSCLEENVMSRKDSIITVICGVFPRKRTK